MIQARSFAPRGHKARPPLSHSPLSTPRPTLLAPSSMLTQKSGP